MTARQITVTLTPAQARALFAAAGRGTDEWEADAVDGGTPRPRHFRTAIAALRDLAAAYHEQTGQKIVRYRR